MAPELTRLTYKIVIRLHVVADMLYHLQFSLQAASPETFGYTLVILIAALKLFVSILPLYIEV
jgi:hypothetical protein